MSFESAVAHMRRELVTGVRRRRRREHTYRAVGAVAVVTALVVAGVALAADSDRPSGVVTHTEDPSEVNPILGHVAFEEARVSIYRA